MFNQKKIILLVIIIILTFSGCGNLENKTKNPVKSKNLPSATKKVKEAPKPKIFKLGSSGSDVKKIQDKLNNYGYAITADGKFGPSTDWAVRDFQYKHNIPIDGSVSDQTMNLLKETPTDATKVNSEVQPDANPEVQTMKAAAENLANSNDTPTFTKFFIITSLKDQRVYVFNGDPHNWKLINTFECTSGSSETPTITGHFYVEGKGLAFKTENDVVCKYYTQIHGNYLFHSILFDKNGNVVDGTLGASLSHGCVRLALQNAKYIYDTVPMGTGIWIF
ncbi:L,D-transpeptidase [Clostridium felsineum]|uniref:L,D-transpeptidase family protein n=1 Tax=Clostridium felsineum TaxID=36839 RepID=UPI00098C74D4|nr:L,D-transpeptidase [Clostridium felsineum]MCR3758568.1 L,D-transpeptidase [Clostridium felsineum]URZ00693.1 hypothetical protein CLAUR_006810 [Clostridium felsineum]